MEILIIIAGFLIIISLWLNVIASIALKHDDMLDPFQRRAQFIIVWLVPLMGASLILYLVNEHSPNVIPRNWIPWPFRSMVFNKQVKSNKFRDEESVEYRRGRWVDHNNIGSNGNDGGD